MCLSKAAAVAVGARSSSKIEALLTAQTSFTPGAVQRPTSASACLAEARSAFTALALPPLAWMSATVCARPAAERL